MARLPVAGPRQLRSIAADGVEAGRRLLTLLPRFEALLDTAEQVLTHVSALVERMERTEAAARRVVTAVDTTHQQVEKLIDDNAAAGARIVEVLDAYLPTLERLRPTLERLAACATPSDVDALIATIRVGPHVADQLDQQVIPMLESLKPVAPDLRELLTSSRALNEIIGTVPGLGRAKKRAEEQLEAAGDDGG